MKLIATTPLFPVLLLTALSLSGLRAETETATPLSDALRPEHRAALETNVDDLRQQLETLAASEQDADSKKAAAEIDELLALRWTEITSDKALVGPWRVRSLQTSSLGAYAYPFFKCTIEREGKSGLVFKKNTGSQRRVGLLARDSETRYLFLGGSYFTDESPVGYSTLQDASVKTDPERDSAGHLYQLADNHLLVIFTTEGGRGEIYELRK